MIWPLLLALSGAASLMYEVVWMRRLGLELGGTATASAVVVGAWMGGMALGGLLARRLPSGAQAPRTYAALELSAALWALAFPALLGLVDGWMALALLIPPTVALGATWPLLARVAGADRAALLYGANTLGAVVGVLAATFVVMPTLGVRGTEVTAALMAIGVAVVAAAQVAPAAPETPKPVGDALPEAAVLGATALAGFSALGLEVVWFRLGAVAFGMTVQNVGLVLAVFLLAVALGAEAARRVDVPAKTGLAWSLGALGVLALLGGLGWSWLPHAMAGLYRAGGPEALLPGSALLAAVAMGGAPAASGAAFTFAVRATPDLDRGAGHLMAANTLGAIAGALVGGLWAVPALEVRGAVLLFALAAASGGSLLLARPWPLLAAGLLAVVLPAWDARLYAVGVHLRISDFADPSAEAVQAFVDEGWELLSYDHGPTGAVAVGRSTRTGHVWLSVNGKVDASTGADMATQRLSGELPVAGAADPASVLVVGLASGVTAGAVLEDDRVRSLTVLEIEPAVVAASHAFDHVNGRPLDDPRTTLHVDDARAWLSRSEATFDVIISEPSNPWITGVSNLFTEEYWRLARARLAPDGVFCQWVQLYGLGTEELRAIVRTFASVFPDTWLFETVEGADVLLISGLRGLDGLPAQPVLDPMGVKRLGRAGWRNTDDFPGVEFRAPRYLHYATAEANREAIEGSR